ncbi:Thioredoxin domain-containing protein PLP3B [Zea mays]|uniref:Thioredoxin domain-containing protein PLP3B n=1 Tax=Zea mays TaxID=4577 RepID=A0A1D6F8G8_MAIZE|nr:Thioredoxin domain-containing protein PLP3B [Zea mays]
MMVNMLPWLNIPSGPVMEGPFDSCVLLDYHLHLTYVIACLSCFIRHCSAFWHLWKLFYLNICQDHDKHLKTLAPVYVGTKFVKLDAENAPFFVAKLAIKILPCVILFK